MESLESKLDRLSPEQRKEVEEFVDFLMYRSGNSPGSPATAPVSTELKKVSSSPAYPAGTSSCLRKSPAEDL